MLQRQEISAGPPMVGASILVPISKMSKHVRRLQAVYGRGHRNYMNDAPTDVAILSRNFSNTKTPILGKALPVVGLVGFLDLKLLIATAPAQSATPGWISGPRTASRRMRSNRAKCDRECSVLPGQRLYVRAEVQWGYRDNRGGWHTPDYRIQFSAKYNFSFRMGGCTLTKRVLTAISGSEVTATSCDCRRSSA